MASTAALRKASSVASSAQTITTNLLPYEPGLRDSSGSSDSDSQSDRSPDGWSRAWVLKYGGSSVGQRLPRVCESIFEHALAGGGKTPVRVSVVVSAMGKTTDMLLDAAEAAKEGNLAPAQEICGRIRTLAVDNAHSVFEHFGVPAAVQEQAQRDVAAVVDATLSGLSDYLQGVSLLRDLSARTLDAILSNGERVSANVVATVLAVVAAAGLARGGSGMATTAQQRLMLNELKPTCVEAVHFMTTDDSFGKAKVDFERTKASLHELARGWNENVLPIFTGFIGRSSVSGSTTTLGRNGSDYSAAVIAAALGAERVIINTDVPGIFTADPRLVPDAFPVPEMSYDEAVELSIYGSKIFHPKTMLPLMKHGVPMVIRNTSDAPGAPSTLISAQRDVEATAVARRRASVLRSPSIRRINSDYDLEKLPSGFGLSDCSTEATPAATPDDTPRAKLERSKAADVDIGAVCIASLEDMSYITVRAEISEDGDSSEVAPRAMQALERAGLTGTWADQRAGNDASILVRRGDRERAAETLRRELKDIRLLELSVTEPVTLLSLVPKKGGSRVAAAARFFNALAKANVHIHRVVCGASTASISCLIDAQETALAVRTAHNAFNFAKRMVSLLLLGENPVVHNLVEQLHRRQLKPHGQLDVRVVGLINASGGLTLAEGSPPAETTADGGVPLCPDGLPLDQLLASMERRASRPRHPEISWTARYQLAQNTVLTDLRRLPTPVLVDCNRLHEFFEDGADGSSAPSMALLSCYLSVLESGVRLSVSNCYAVNAFAAALRSVGPKLPQPLGLPAAPAPAESPVAVVQRRRNLFRFDCAASYGPPLLETIRDRLQAGRRIGAVEASLSATLGVVLDRMSRCGDSLRAAAQFAHAMGITEPKISSDLSGQDIIQKLRVVAFALGCELSDADVEHAPLIPAEVLSGDTREDPSATFAALEAFDAREKLAERAQAAFKAGRRWRYLATLELRGSGRASVRVGLREVDEEHFAYPIRGQEVVCALWEHAADAEKAGSLEEAATPMLVLRGQGAGKAAGDGVLSDVVTLVGL